MGVKPTTMGVIDRELLAGKTVWHTAANTAAVSAARTAHAALTTAAVAWWHERLLKFEVRTKQGLIVHPRDIMWSLVYREQFVPFMRLMGINWALPKRALPKRARRGDSTVDETEESDGVEHLPVGEGVAFDLVVL